MSTAVVTGGGSGIGRAAALALADAGYSVVVAGRKQGNLDETVAMGAKEGHHLLAIPTDVRDPGSVQSLFARVRDELGRLDLLFNNAGTFPPQAAIEDLSLEAWAEVIDTNLTGTFLCTQQAIMLMKAQNPRGGRIINNGSLSAHSPRPNAAPYVAAKHAVAGLTKSTALEGRRHDIACGQIDIGNAATRLTEPMRRGIVQASGATEVEPTIDLEDVARAVVFMASLPLDANVLSMTVMATKMPFVGRG